MSKTVPLSKRRTSVLFEERGYWGRSLTVDAAMATLRGFANRAASVQMIGGTWELRESSGFRGRCRTISNRVPDLDSLGLRNRIESARPRTSPF